MGVRKWPEINYVIYACSLLISNFAQESPKQSKPVRSTRISTLQMYRSILKAQKDMEDEDSDDTEDEEDITFDGGVAERYACVDFLKVE